ncbi:efflux RND transporter periplasmic adaptor subunit [Alteromonas hispanica]|uniref:Efflux RND transporter periplasmic adaptor subunit n=1 Tax=Alteromonas hispanica TaxID=315421 RepID=A0A6L9MYD5_9ALTE|nr:efflux RND transporter periplasmic adaptor subunit [Alteromonas hispanica]NDW22851.1 efflux RND transporter periplasmic adaptor subunit [Alteromonas hispanica]
MSSTDTASNANKMPLYIAIMVFIASLVALLMAAGQGNATQTMGQREPVSVVLTKVEMRQQFETPINVFGLIESPKSTMLSFDSSGEVTEVLVEEGDTVSKGDVLARLDTQRLVAQQKELSASLERVKADLNLAKINNDRTQSLVKKKLESAQRLDETQAALNVAAARVNEISASLNSMNVALDRAILYAPFDGQVDSRLFDEGSVINAGMAVIGVTSNDKYQARFAVPADIVDQFEIGESVTMQVGESDVQGTVSQRLAVRNIQTRTVDILVSLSSNTQVRPGDMAILSGSRIHTEQGAWLPVSALSNGLRGLWRVLVLDNQGGDNGVGTLQARVVDVVYTDGSKAFVRGALKEQEQVVVGGTHKLAPGQRVKAGTASAELGEMMP